MRAADMTVRRDNVGHRESNPGFGDIPKDIEKAIQVLRSVVLELG
jgi:hypothetical protein